MMAAMTIRNIPDDVHKAIKARAERHGRSAEAEVRALLAAAVDPRKQLGFGTWLASLGAGVWDDDLDRSLVRQAVEPVDLG